MVECSTLLCVVLTVSPTVKFVHGMSYFASVLFLTPTFFTLTTSRVSTPPAVEPFDDFEDKCVDEPRGGDETVFDAIEELGLFGETVDTNITQCVKNETNAKSNPTKFPFFCPSNNQNKQR